MCPYFAMFPEEFVETHLLAYSRPGDVVFDPFSGRGTTVLQSLLMNRQAIAMDINPVAACVSGAKARIPPGEALDARIEELEKRYSPTNTALEMDEFFELCFHNETFSQLLYLRNQLRWRDDDVDRFLAATLLGCLHGESHRTELCLSNRMPRTISTKPDYSVRWWKARGLRPPERSCFKVLRQLVRYRLSKTLPAGFGEVHLADARLAAELFRNYIGRVNLIVTSPPYLDTTDYGEDQWLRLWFLGGPNRPQTRLFKDDRYTNERGYWDFLLDVWSACCVLLAEKASLVIRIGGSMLAKESLMAGLSDCLHRACPDRDIQPVHDGVTTPIRRRQTNSFRPGTSRDRFEHDFTFLVK